MFTTTGLEALEPRRMLSAGDLDTSFGDGGIVTTTFDGDVMRISSARQSDGKLLVAADVSRPKIDDSNTTLLRYLGNGQIDSKFGDHGKVILGSFSRPFLD